MLASSRQTGSLNALHFLLVFLLQDVVCLELQPSSPEVILDPGSNFTVVCSGWSRVTWRSPRDSDNVLVDDGGSSSVLQLLNATWRNSGRYSCEEASASESRDIDLFIPGRGPEEWFVPAPVSVVMRGAGLVATVPCVVSDPRLNVSLVQRPGRSEVRDVTFDPGRGFTGRLNDTAYVCVASGGGGASEGGGAERESQVFYVFSIEVPQELQVDLSVSSQVVRQGEVLTVNCTATDTGNVFFSWDFPRRQTFEPLTDFLPNQISSFVNITAATVEDSGVYVCEVQETKPHETKITKNITVTVLERGYVYLSPGESSLSVLLHQDVELQVEVEAHPPPTALWTRDNVSLDGSTTHLTGSRYVSTLALTQVQVSQTGNYTVTVSNDDAVEEVIFTLEVKAPPRITSLVEVNRKSVMCVSEGAPPPLVTWYTCHSTHRCSNATDGWESQSAASEGVTLTENVTQEERGVAMVHSVLTLQSFAAVSAVRCEVQNSAGRRARELRVLNTSLLSQVAVLAAVLALVIVAVIFLVILIILWRKKPGFQVRWRLLDSVSPDGLKSSYLDPDQLDYCSSWEVPRDHVVLGEVLGSGAFGRVVEATVSGLSHPQSTTRAAVKMVKPSRVSVESLMSELKILIHVGRHVNLVNLLGACTRGGPVYLITEFCRHGDLVTFLHRHKHTFRDTHTTSDGDGGYMDMTSQEVQYVAMKELEPADIQPDVYETPTAPSGFLLLSDSDVLDLHDLRTFCFQIANAMNFLSDRQCVHRDVSARNVLVCEGKLLKLCDFSLSRDLNKDQDYVARGQDFLPVRWMSPESLYRNVYSIQSDVWAYGVLLWEIFSLGATPYPDLSRVQDLYSALKSGYRMSRPDLAPPDMFELMTRCWGEEPQSRPSFSSLVVAVGDTLTDSYKKRYVQVSEDFLNRPGPPGSGSSPGPAGSRSSPGPPGSRSSPGPPGSRSSPGPAGSGSSPGHQRDQHEDTDGSPAPQVTVHLLEAESEEAGSSHGSHINPVSDSAAPDAGRPVDTPGGQEVTSKEEESCL